MADLKAGVPFDLNALVHYSLGFDQLWLAIEYILDQLTKQAKTMDKLEKDVKSRTGLIDK